MSDEAVEVEDMAEDEEAVEIDETEPFGETDEADESDEFGLPSEAETITELVRMIAVALADDKDAVSVDTQITSDDNRSISVNISVAPDDTGKVIGRQGHVIKSIRALARANAAYLNYGHVDVEVLD
ncbi:MAG: KH domain-containing protein [Coriobacteriales bacterium]|jgi:predicted RNA-binding protein YlqC (UPF0109 family)|nr:KH domain-containing protein [Coriobacteriales bacterium]